MTDKPAYRDRYPCRSCATGYLDCAQAALVGLQCCRECRHPERWITVPPYTDDEIADMNSRRA